MTEAENMPDVKELETALKNAIKPEYELRVTCPECYKNVRTDNGEWLLWCGGKEHAQVILDAAKAYLKQNQELVMREMHPPITLNTRPSLPVAKRAALDDLNVLKSDWSMGLKHRSINDKGVFEIIAKIEAALVEDDHDQILVRCLKEVRTIMDEEWQCFIDGALAAHRAKQGEK